jgi:hypothetical protein
MILEVWQGKELRVDFSDVWQRKGLEEEVEVQETRERGGQKPIVETQGTHRFRRKEKGTGWILDNTGQCSMPVLFC